MEKVFGKELMEMHTLGSGIRTEQKDMVPTPGLQEIDMMANGFKVKSQVRALTSFQMVIHTMEAI